MKLSRKTTLRRAALEALEPRQLLAVLPPPTVVNRSDVSNPFGVVLGTNESSPSIAVDPNDALKLVATWTASTFPTDAVNIRAGAAYSNDGGATWASLTLPAAVFSPADAPTGATRLPQVTDASVAIGRDDQVYILTAQHTSDNKAGALVLQKFDFRGASPVQTVTNRIVDAWDTNAAITPTIAVDATLPSYVDPATGSTLTNPYSGNVYVAWASADVASGNYAIKIVSSSDGGQTFTTRRTVNDEQDADGNFVPPDAPGPTQQNTSGNSGRQLNAMPRLSVSQGTADGRVRPGQVTVVWNDYGTGDPSQPVPVDLIRTDRLVGAVGQTFTAPGDVIRPATDTGATTTDFPITVDITDPRFGTVSDFDVRLAINDPTGGVQSVTLIAPDGRTLPLVSGGLGGLALGIGGGGTVNGTSGTVFGTIFDQEALDPWGAGTTPFIGHFKPAWQPPPATGAVTTFNLSDFYNDPSTGRTTSPGQVAGTWIVRVVNAAGLGGGSLTNPPRLREASLVFTSRLDPGADVVAAETAVTGIARVTTPVEDKQPYPLSAAAFPAEFDRGVGPSPTIASDNTLGAFMDRSGRIYLAYVDHPRNDAGQDLALAAGQPDNTDIFLVASDDGGLTWTALGGRPVMVNDDVNSNNDGFTESFVTRDATGGLTSAFGRPQFMPSLAVDPATGTLGVGFYDARHDGARARVATTITTSLDGGRTFSPQNLAFANTPNAPFDEIERNPNGVVLGPIPDNLSNAVPANPPLREGVPGLGYGEHQSLAFLQGHIYVAWSGNENGGNVGQNRLDVRVARADTAAGPRVISSTMGPVKATTVDGVTFNAPLTGDSSPRAEGFVVTFDRPVDARTFTLADVRAFFRRPTDASGQVGASVAIGSVTPLDPSGPTVLVGGQPRQIKATTFLVRFAQAQTATGTYSYAVGPDVRDFAGASTTTLTSPSAATTVATADAPLYSVVRGLPQAIAANATTEANLVVNGLRADDLIAGLEVALSATFPRDGDLRISLVGPDGTTVVPLALNRGGAGANFLGTTFSDTASTPIAAGVAPFDAPGGYRPESPLSVLAGLPANGTYKLRIVNVGSATGTLDAFSVKVRTGSVVGNVPLILPDTGRALATLDVAGFQASETIAGTRVHVALDHPRPGDLRLTLIAPDGTRVPLATNRGGSSANAFTNTTFDDAASASIATAAAPFVGSYRPETPLSVLAGKPLNGLYRLEVVDTATGSVGTVRGFTIDFTTSSSFGFPGGNIPDAGSVDRRVTIAGFAPGQSISKATVNLTISHPRPGDLRLSLISPTGIVVPLATNRGGSSANAYTDTTFDDAASASIATAAAPFTGSFRPESPLSALAGQDLNGIWTLRIADTVPGQSGSLSGASLVIETQALAVGDTAVGVPDAGRVVSTLDIAPAGTIAGVDATVTVNHPNVQELSLYLVAPDGTRVALVDRNPTGGANYTNTTFSDAAAVSIVAGPPTAVAPYTGSFRPVDPQGLAKLIGGPSNGTWRLEVVDRTGNSVAGALQSWSLNVRTAAPFSSSDVPRGIPEGNPVGVDSTLGIFGLPPGSRIAAVPGSVELTLNVTHPADQELAAVLTSPGGATIRLFNAGQASGGNFTNTIFSDLGAAILPNTGAPYNSGATTPPTKYRPVDSFSALFGADPNGIWTLRLVDSVTGTPANVGTITGWSLSLQTTAQYAQTPAPIPAAGVAVATLAVADFPAGAALDGADVTVSVDHPNTGDLALYLVAPDGTRVPLALNRGSGADFAGTTFSDDASQPISAGSSPFTGSFRPEVPLSSLAGLAGPSVNGVWRLEAVNSGGSAGTITGFQLGLRAAATFGLLPGPIPDNGQATATLDVSGVPAGEVIDEVDVLVSAAHPRVGDLTFTLVGPDGTRVLLSANNGGTGPDSANYLNTVFTDGATLAINAAPPSPLTTLAPFTGRFRPQEPLASLKGSNPNGTWRLEVRDSVTGEVGTLTDFQLRIRTVPAIVATDVPKAIPNPGVVTSSVTASGFDPLDRLADVNVIVSIDHPKVEDLRLALVGPDGTRVPLLINAAPSGTISGKNLTGTAFDDQAAQAIASGAAPFTGRFRPQAPLGAFDGRSPNGTWTLEVRDATNNTDAGTLLSWSLELKTAARDGQTPRPINDLSDASSAILVQGLPAGSVVTGAEVSVSIDHPKDSNLDLYLVAPDGTIRVPLSLGNGGTGANYAGTTFTDAAAIPITAGSSPFTGSFRPQVPLAALNGIAPNGLWRLVVVDRGTGTPLPDEGTLKSWSLTLRTATPTTPPPSGNMMDQDTDATPGEATDSYAAPRSFAGIPFASNLDRGINGIPFQFPFDPTTLPLIVPGPHVVDTRVPGVVKTVDNLVTDQAVSALDVTFDRDMNAATFTGADILRVDGPSGVIGPGAGASVPAEFTVEADPLNTGSKRTFRIHFWAPGGAPSAQDPTGTPLNLALSGTYGVVIGPDVESTTGDKVDANLNAGLDALRGVVDPQTGVTVPLTVDGPGVAIPRGGTVSSTITLSDDFLIQDLNLRLDITHPFDPDLTVRLVAEDPSGDPTRRITVLLFSGVGNTGDRANFSNTVFDDQATTAIQDGGPPFFVGPFNPQVGLPDPTRPGTTGVSLGELNLKGSARTWRLEITDAGTGGDPLAPRLLNSWSLIFKKPVPSTGLGEPVADRTTTSFRIFTMAPTSPMASSTWTAVGPAGTGARGPGLNAEVAGRVGALAVDPSDPSGNTVYAGGASGGVWKTTNFLTTRPTGPTWVPLTDDGPASGLNISSLTIVPRNNDPDQSIVFALTGEGDATGDPLRPSALTSRGVGVLRSIDGGKTWNLLDSRNNTLPFAQRDHFFAAGNGTTGYKIVADPRLTPSGDAIVYAALSDLSPTGGDTYNQIALATTGVVRGGLWRSVDSGRTWQQMRAGQATDVVLDPNSATGAPDGNLQFVYAAFRNDGIYFSPNRGQLWNPLPGVTGVPLIQNADFAQPQPVGVVGPPPPQFLGIGGSNRPVPNSYVTTDANGTTTVPAAAEPSLGKIILAKPALIPASEPNAEIRNLIYQGYIYAAVMIHNEGDLVQFPPPLQPPSSLFRIFVSKDFGQNWTPIISPTIGIPTNAYVPQNPVGFTGTPDPTGNGSPGGSYYFKGNFSSALVVDPNDPNIVYFGGTDMFGSSNLVRIDTTGIADPHAFYLSNDDPDLNPTMGQFRTYNGFPASVPGTGPQGINVAGSPLTLFYTPPFPFFGPTDPVTNDPPGAYNPKTSPFLNLIRDPAQPFRGGATILVTGVARFNNTGTHATWQPYSQAVQPDPFLAPDPADSWSRPTRGQHEILAIKDPLTGRTRLIFGNDNGVYTSVDEGDGTLVGSIGGVVDPTTRAGNVEIVNGSRNGNLQIAQFRAGAVQPSLLSAQLSSLRGMIYGLGEDTGQTMSDPGIVTPGQPGYGDISWNGGQNIDYVYSPDIPPTPSTRETGWGLATEQNYVVDPATGLPTVRGLVYQFMQPEGLVERDFVGDTFHASTDFFQVNGISRTFGLLQSSFGGDVPDPQWPFRRSFPFAVNTINGDQAVISSVTGRIFGTETQGRVWSAIGNPTALDGTEARSLAYGAPDPNAPGGVGNLGSFIYAGTIGAPNAVVPVPGHVFVTRTGGGANGNQWTNISDPLTGVSGQVVRYGLDGSPLASIMTNPTRGSHEAFAVTEGGWDVTQIQDANAGNTGQVPDGGNKTTLLTVSDDFGAFRIADLKVTANIAAPVNSSLDVFLVAPDGTRYLLATGLAGANITNATFDDDAPLSITAGAAPYTGTFRPVQKLVNPSDPTSLYNKELRGAWGLLVVDKAADGQAASINNFSITATSLGGVFHIADSVGTNPATSRWEAITGNLFGLSRDPFGDSSLRQPAVTELSSIVADWRYVLPDDVNNPDGPSHPILYVAGQGGVFRSLDKGVTWEPFPSSVPGSLPTTPTPPGSGGGLPAVQVTDLDLSLGIIDPATGRANPAVAVGPNILVASTYGRGSFAIRLAPTVFSQTLRLSDTLPDPPGAMLGGSDSGNPGTAVGFDDLRTRVTQPVFTGNSQQSAFGNVVTVNLIDLTPTIPGGPLRDPASAPIIGTGTTDSAGRFSIQIIAGYFEADGSTDGPKTIGVRATDQAGTEGNVALFSFTLDTTPPAKPDAPDLQDVSDTGISNTDNITRDQSPFFFVTVIEPLAMVQLFRDDTTTPVATLVDVVPDAQGRVAIQDPGLAPDGKHRYYVKQFDVAGNLGQVSDFLEVEINTTPPTEPGVPDLIAADDTPLAGPPPGLGYDPTPPKLTNADNVTFINQDLRFDVADVEANTTLELLRDGVTVNTVIVGDGGTIRIADPTTVPDGAHGYKVRLTNQAGNIVLVSGTLTVTVDTVAPAKPSAADLEDRSDTGVSPTDNITNDVNPFFMIALAEAGSTVQLLRKVKGQPDSSYVVAAQRTGPGEVQDANNLADNDYTYAVRVFDLAGNVGPLGDTLDVTVDTIALTPPGPPDLVATSDTPFDGELTFRPDVTDKDNITRITLFQFPAFEVTGEADSTIYLLRRDEGTTATTTVGFRRGPGLISDPASLNDGVYFYSTYQDDLAGNRSGVSPELEVTIDTVAPSSPSAPDLQAGSDSGSSATDNVTGVTTPTFDITIPAAEAGGTLVLLRDGQIVQVVFDINGVASGSNLVATIQDPNPASNPVTNGQHTYTAFLVDLAGNAGPIGGALQVTFDLNLPDAPSAPDLVAASDSGASNADNYTNVTLPTFTVATAQLDATVELLRKPKGAPDSSYVVAASRTGPGTLTEGTPLADGVYTYASRQINPAGGAGTVSGTLDVTIDTTVAPPNPPDLDATSDTGDSTTDNLTSTPRPVFNLAPAEPGATLQLLRRDMVYASDGTVRPIGDAPAAPLRATIVVPDDGGAFRVADLVVTLDVGHGRVADLTGILIAPDGTRVRLFSGVGGASGANLTATTFDDRAATPIASGTAPFEGTFRPDQPLSTLAGKEMRGTWTLELTDTVAGTAGQLNSWSLDFTGALARSGAGPVTEPLPLIDGTYTYAARQIDLAGNVSAETATTLTITVDRTPPSAPGAPILQAGSDTGRSNSDRITADRKPWFDIASVDPGTTVQLLRNGTVVATRVGPGPIRDEGPGAGGLIDGTYNYTARQVDAAGNLGPSSSPATVVTIDTTPPAAPGVPDLQAGSDTGSSDTDNITSDTSPWFDVTPADATALVELLRNGSVVGSRIGPGPIRDLNVPSGTYAYTARQTDLAGNVGDLSASLSPVIVEAGTVPTPDAPDLVDASDSGVSKADNITNATSRTFRLGGTFGVTDTVVLLRKVAGASDASYVEVGRILNVGMGTERTITDRGVLADGQYDYAARVLRPSGGSSSLSSPTRVTLDTTPPSAPALTLVNDTGTPSDGVTTARRPRLSGQTERGAVVELLGPGDVVLTTTTASPIDGRFTLEAPADLLNGRYIYRAQARDAAGNQGGLGQPLSVTLVTASGDFDGDGRADLAVVRPDVPARWFISQSVGGGRVNDFGAGTLDIPLAGDFDGDGRLDLAVYRPGSAEWFIRYSGGGARHLAFGQAGVDIAVPADYDGDGKADLAVFRPTTGEWFILQSSLGGRYQPFGGPGDIPVPADYDGDGKADLATFRRGDSGQWFILRSQDGPRYQPFGASTDTPTPADYDGDGKVDIATFRPSTGEWFLLQSRDGARYQPALSAPSPGDLPVSADYDGDGKADVTVFSPSSATWTFARSTAGRLVRPFGQANYDVPLLAPYDARRPRVGSRARGLEDAPVFTAAAPEMAVVPVASAAEATDPGRLAFRFASSGRSSDVTVDGTAPAASRRRVRDAIRAASAGGPLRWWSSRPEGTRDEALAEALASLPWLRRGRLSRPQP